MRTFLHFEFQPWTRSEQRFQTSAEDNAAVWRIQRTWYSCCMHYNAKFHGCESGPGLWIVIQIAASIYLLGSRATSHPDQKYMKICAQISEKRTNKQTDKRTTRAENITAVFGAGTSQRRSVTVKLTVVSVADDDCRRLFPAGVHLQCTSALLVIAPAMRWDEMPTAARTASGQAQQIEAPSNWRRATCPPTDYASGRCRRAIEAQQSAPGHSFWL